MLSVKYKLSSKQLEDLLFEPLIVVNIEMHAGQPTHGRLQCDMNGADPIFVDDVCRGDVDTSA